MNEQIIAILHKSINGEALTEDEKKLLDEWIGQSEHNRGRYQEIMSADNLKQDIEKMLGQDSHVIWTKINQQLYPFKHKSGLLSIFRRGAFWYAAAALFLIFAFTTAYILFVKPSTNSSKDLPVNKSAAIAEVVPGSEKAVLVLDNGTSLALDKTSNGKIAEQGNTIIVKEDGLLSYNTHGQEPSSAVFYNTLTTPRGAYYSSLVLADGSKVWLNAESSIRFPTAFTGKDRVVDVSGEVYFEVAKNAAKPFKVNVNEKDMSVEVLGTHFNVNAYNDEADIKTTLLEGAVKITADGKSGFLKPGQQARVASLKGTNGGEVRSIRVVNDADPDEVVAWKNGMFQFQNADIRTIMRQVEKWYDADVVYDGNTDRKFFAEIPRSVDVSKLLTILEKTGWIQFKVEGKKITVIPVK